MKNTLTKAGLTLLTLSLVACGGDSSSDEAFLAPPPDMTAPPPYSLLGETFVSNKSEPYVHNNAKKENPIYDLNAIYLDGVYIPLPIRGEWQVRDKKPYYVMDGKSYKVFIANDSRDMSYSRYAYLRNANDQKIYSFSGEFTRDMPKSGVASYKGDAIHTFVDKANIQHITRADAKASIDFSKPHDDSAVLMVSIAPRAGSSISFKPFEFGARVQDHMFRGENPQGSVSADKADPTMRKGRNVVESEGQFNGPNASELVGHYKVQENAEYPRGAEGVFGLKREN